MLSPGDMRPGNEGSSGGDQLFRSITRLVANSGIQFIDIEVPRSVVDGVTRSFAVERVGVPDGSVWALAPVQPTASDAPGEPGSTRLRIDGRSAVRAAFDHWLPLPLLRFVARDGEGRPHFDDGPCNWARVFLADPASDGDPGGPVRGVIAIDTAIEPQSRLDIESYQAPTADDARFLSTFALTDDAESLAPFLAEDWVQDWIAQVFPVTEVRRGATAPDQHSPMQTGPLQGLQQVASYLAVLTIIRRAGALPSLQFFDARPEIVPTVPVDLVLDIGHARSCCLMVESSPDGDRPSIENAALLALRDLSRPVDMVRGAFASHMEFARATFGSEALSRRSGRPDAFHWPSLARTGPEAVRLSRVTRAGDGPTGLASPKRHLADQGLRDEAWRFAIDQRSRAQRSAMLTGRMLTHVSETVGRLLPGPAGAVRPLSLRPRFSLSSMTSFFVAEIVLQALSAINAPVVATGGRRRPGDPTEAAAARRADGVRRLRQIIVCAPLTLPLEERQLLRERAESAIDMLWRALGWDDAADGAGLPRPTVRLGLDETLAAQLVYLFDEVGQRFGGDTRAVMNLLGKTRPDSGVEPCLRIGAMDIGGGFTTMTVVTYAQTAERSVSPVLLGAQRSEIGGELVLERLVTEIICPALLDALAAHGMRQPAAFLARAAAFPGHGAAYDISAPSARLYEHWLRPAALGLLTLAGDAPSATARLSLSLNHLAARASGTPNPNVAMDFDAAAAAQGAHDLRLADVVVAVRLMDVMAIAKTALAPMVARLSRALVASDCDVVLLTGWASRLPVVRDLLLEAMPWRPDRFVTLSDRAWLDWYPMSDEARQLAGGKDVALIGALLALSRGGLGFGDDDGASFGNPIFEGGPT